MHKCRIFMKPDNYIIKPCRALNVRQATQLANVPDPFIYCFQHYSVFKFNHFLETKCIQYIWYSLPFPNYKYIRYSVLDPFSQFTIRPNTDLQYRGFLGILVSAPSYITLEFLNKSTNFKTFFIIYYLRDNANIFNATSKFQSQEWKKCQLCLLKLDSVSVST